MADQMINQLPVKTAPQTGDKFLVVGAAEEQLIDYDKLADAILTKLASKTFALDQGTKSLVTAINELNSKIERSGGVYVDLGSCLKTIGLEIKEYTCETLLKVMPRNTYIRFTYNKERDLKHISDLPIEYGLVSIFAGNTENYNTIFAISNRRLGDIYLYEQDANVNEDDGWVKISSTPAPF
nr:MAG TPA: hypothetical protein [Caudoviricetes sp.]